MDAIEKTIEQRCATCEFMFGGEEPGKYTCGGGDKTPGHEYGHTITDKTDTCTGWGAGYDTYCEALTKEKGRGGRR